MTGLEPESTGAGLEHGSAGARLEAVALRPAWHCGGLEAQCCGCQPGARTALESGAMVANLVMGFTGVDCCSSM